MKLIDLIEKVDLTTENQNGNSYITKDYVFFDDTNYIIKLKKDERIAYPTDYAVLNGLKVYKTNYGYKDKKPSIYWTRYASYDAITAIMYDGTLGEIYADSSYCGLHPVMHLNLNTFISTQKSSPDFSEISISKNNGLDDFHTLTFGEYPKTYVGDRFNNYLESSLSSLKKTGKLWDGYLEDDVNTIKNEEFEYNGEKYVRVKTQSFESYDHPFKWVKVEPITWVIRNWKDMPKEINPKGKDKAKYIDIQTEDCIMSGIPFNNTPENSIIWKNSYIRKFLNNEFLHSAFSAQVNQNINYSQQKHKQYNPYKFVFDNLSNDDLLKLYVNSNSSVFLHGPSGVGKSQRVKQLDPTATRITLRPQMNPEEIDGILDRETGKFIPPLWYTQLTEKCKAEPGRKHVLFIDELTNVKPTIQSLIYSIVLDRAGKDGLWPLPNNVVVVAAGNESADNLAAYPLTNALFRRFSHIYFEVNKGDWLDWATGVTKNQKLKHIENETEQRSKIHPAIIAYVMSRDKSILNQDLDEDNPTIVTDPRKWEIASNILYSTKNPKALLPAIGEELTADFVDFVQTIHLSVEDVVKGRYDKREFQEMDISKKLSTLVGLWIASEKDLLKVRKFILENMGKEILATYDLLWIRNDPERAEIIAENNLKMIDNNESFNFKI